MSRLLKKTVAWLLVITLILILCSNYAQKLFYYPDNVEYGSPKDNQPPFENITFQSKDGTKLNGWFIPATGL